MTAIMSIIILFTFNTTKAQQPGQQPSKPFCEQDAGFNEWDFWVGDWTVTWFSTGQFVGENTITKVAEGCLILEDWRGIQNAMGTSMNYYNPITKKWRQLWIDNAGFEIRYEGGLQDGVMILEGKFMSHHDGSETDFRGRWTPLEDGDVRQEFEMKNAETGEWVKNWDARYTRKS